MSHLMDRSHLCSSDIVCWSCRGSSNHSNVTTRMKSAAGRIRRTEIQMSTVTDLFYFIKMSDILSWGSCSVAIHSITSASVGCLWLWRNFTNKKILSAEKIYRRHEVRGIRCCNCGWRHTQVRGSIRRENLLLFWVSCRKQDPVFVFFVLFYSTK